MRRGTPDHASSGTGKILLDAVYDQAVILNYGGDRVGLTGPDFGSQDPVRRKKPRCSFGYCPMRSQTVFTTIESPTWVVAGDLARQ
jgi:hypothetical protein